MANTDTLSQDERQRSVCTCSDLYSNIAISCIFEYGTLPLNIITEEVTVLRFQIKEVDKLEEVFLVSMDKRHPQ
jgi:hypothetical protein